MEKTTKKVYTKPNCLVLETPIEPIMNGTSGDGEQTHHEAKSTDWDDSDADYSYESQSADWDDAAY